MDDLEPLALDRELGRAALAWRKWRRRLVQGEGLEEDPFARFRPWLGRSAFQAIDESSALQPLTTPFRRWVYRLAEQRIDREALIGIARSYRVTEHVVDRPEHVRLPLARLLANALAEPRRSRDWLDSYLGNATALAAEERRLWQRRSEIAARMQLGSPDAIERCSTASTALARDWLALTRDTASEFFRERLDRTIDVALGREAHAGWPARLSLRTLGDWLNEARLLDGLELDPGEFPAPLASASFLRGLRRFGTALADAAAPKRQPFVVRHDPYGLRRRSIGSLLGLLSLNPDFLQRRLGLGKGAAADQRRVLGRVVLLESRAAALRLVLRDAALAGEAAFQQGFAEAVESELGTALRPELAGAIYRLHVDDDQRFCGLLLGGAHAHTVVERHDVDWYRNPRAAEELRATLDLSPETQVGAETLTPAAELTRRALLDCLR